MQRAALCIYTTLENQKKVYQAVIVRVEGKITTHYISILIDLGYTRSYLTPKVSKNCGQRKKNHDKSWLVQLATSTKRKVSEVVREFPIEFNGFSTIAKLKIIPLGPYYSLIIMDSLEQHRAKVDCYEEIMKCQEKEGRPIEIKGIP